MMSQQKFDQTLSNQTATARKVFEVIPEGVTMPMKQIISAVGAAGLNNQHSIMAGCLNTLMGVGLLLEPEKGHFCRATVRKAKLVRVVRPRHVDAQAEAQPSAVYTAPESTAPKLQKSEVETKLADAWAAADGRTKESMAEDRLGHHSADLKKLATDLETLGSSLAAAANNAVNVAKSVRNIAAGIENEALDFAQLCEDNAKALAKLKGLKGLFEGV